MNKLWIAVLALASVGTAGAQVKIAIINTQKALLETEEIKKAQLDLEAKFKPRQDEMVKLQKELQDIQAQLNKASTTSTVDAELAALKAEVGTGTPAPAELGAADQEEPAS